MFRSMGKGTGMRGSRRFEQQASLIDHIGLTARPKDAAHKRSVRLKLDVPLLLVVITLLIFGLIMVYSASYDYSLYYYNNANTIFIRQVAWMAIGLVAASFLTWFDYRYFQKLAVPIIIGTILLLLGVLIVANVRNNAVRTLIDGSVQPSELAKVATVIYLSVWLFSKRDQLKDITFGLIPLSLILGGIGGLIFVQPDLSAVITIVFLGGCLFFLAGGDLKQIGVMLILALFVGYFVVRFHSTGSVRVGEHLAGTQSLLNASYHVQRALEAFLKGGWFGVGLGKADTKLTGLPVPPTDSIFAVVGEEIGVVGASAVVILYLVLLWRGLAIAFRAPDDLGKLMAAGLSLWIAVEAFINMSVMVNLVPFAGNALPFISAGGSNLVIAMSAVGILLNISRASAESQEDSGRLFGAVIDLRRWDRRRGVSRSRRSARPDSQT